MEKLRSLVKFNFGEISGSVSGPRSESCSFKNFRFWNQLEFGQNEAKWACKGY